MKKLLIILFIGLLFTVFHKVIISKIILINMSKWTEREIYIKKIDINYFKKEIVLDKLEVRNIGKSYYKNIFEANKVKVKYNFGSLFTDLIKIDHLHLLGTVFFLELDDKIISNTISSDNMGIVEKIIKNKTQPPKIYPKKKMDKNFLILKTKIDNSKAFIKTTSKPNEIVINLSNISFTKIGNEKKSQHFKKAFRFILGDLFFRIPDQGLRDLIKKAYKL